MQARVAAGGQVAETLWLCVIVIPPIVFLNHNRTKEGHHLGRREKVEGREEEEGCLEEELVDGWEFRLFFNAFLVVSLARWVGELVGGWVVTTSDVGLWCAYPFI